VSANIATAQTGRISEVVRYFLRLGTIGFGCPVALAGQMERELVTGRGWLTRDQMREAIAICQSLPGPLAIQVGIYASYLRAGFWGAWAGGWAFILPNFIIIAALGALFRGFPVCLRCGLSGCLPPFYGSNRLPGPRGLLLPGFRQFGRPPCRWI
jgi:chromate transporter